MRKIAGSAQVSFTPENWLRQVLGGRDRAARLGTLSIRVARKTWTFHCSEQEWLYTRSNQSQTPQRLVTDSESGNHLWWYQDLFYWEEYDYTPDQFHAVLHRKHARKQQQAVMAVNIRDMRLKSPVRQAIPDEVKAFVYNRDQGRCVRCGSGTELQFDHVIPVVGGGATTADNLQILCGPCNRAKGSNIALPEVDRAHDMLYGSGMTSIARTLAQGKPMGWSPRAFEGMPG